jgi:Uma2 family endonuclease
MDAELVKTMTEVEVVRRRFTVAELLRLSETGFLGDDERVELIRGEIIEMSPINAAHASTVSRLLSLLSRVLGERVILSVQNPVQLDDESLPQPDITLLRPRDDFYHTKHPGPQDVLLLIEVSDSTLNYDRRTKRALYGAAGIVEYWVINLPNRRIEVFREPQPDGYRTTTRYAPGEMLSPLAFDDIVLNVKEILSTDTSQ